MNLDDDPASLKRVLNVLNFYSPPVNQVDHRKCANMETILANSFRKEHLDQNLEHYKPKTIDPFIRGQHTTLKYFTTLLENLCVACICLMRFQLKSNHNPLARWLEYQTSAVVAPPEFKSWHVKHQANCP